MAEPRALLLAGTAAALAAAVAAGLAVDMHPHFDFERWPGFFAAAGIAGCAVLLVFAALASRILDRPAGDDDDL